MNRVARLYLEVAGPFRQHFIRGAAALLLVDLIDFLPPLALAHLIDSAAKESGGPSIPLVAGGYLGAILLQHLFRYPMKLGFMGAAMRTAGRLRERYGRHLLRLPGEAMTAFSRGDLVTRGTADLEIVERSLGLGLLFIVDSAIYLLAIPVVLIAINPRLTLWALLPLPVIAMWVYFILRWIGTRAADALESQARLSSRVLENANASLTVRAYGLEVKEARRFEPLLDDCTRRTITLAKLESGFSLVLQILISLGAFLVLYAGARGVLDGQLSKGKLVAFLQYVGMAAWPLSGISWGIILLRKGGRSLDRVFEVLGREGTPSGAGNVIPNEVHLEVRNLTYSYPGSTRPALRGISFSLLPGDRVALVGASGSGKSTLLDLLSGYLSSPPGMIFINGLDASSPAGGRWNSYVATVPQQAFLFEGTIEENIRLGTERKPDEVLLAAGKARVTQDAYPQGLSTMVGEGGTTLSGGQRQRVMLARALIREAPLLILDDATSALDGATEAVVFEELEKPLGRETILFSTHRISCARRANRILVLSDGQITEAGAHDELVSRGGFYAALAEEESVEEGRVPG